MRQGRWLLLIAILGIVAVLLSHAQPTARFHEAGTKGITWLLAYPEDYGNSGVFWVLNDIEERFCKSETLREDIQERFERYPRKAQERAYFSFPEIPIAPELLEDASLGRYDQWLLAALSCKEAALPAETKEAFMAHEGSSGYDLTHKYLALTYMDRLGCTLPELAARDRIAKRMAEDGSASSFVTDLSIEQAAFLMWGGHAELVSDAWLERIRKAQDSSGGWKGEYAEATPHATALATWALVQRTHACPL